MDMNFIFSWSTRYLTSERSERVRYRVDHEKIKFISTRGHVISSMYLIIYRTYHISCLMAVYNLLSEIERQLMKAPLAPAISPY